MSSKRREVKLTTGMGRERMGERKDGWEGKLERRREELKKKEGKREKKYRNKTR